jgi:hypothetical protein
MRDQLSRPLAAPHPTEAKLVPGYLLTPFGWAAQLLAGIVDAEPDLLAHVFELDRQRMHVIALALAHLDGKPPPQLGPVLLRGSARDLLHRVLGRSPVGIKRVLRRLPFAVLSQLSYRRLVQLLDDPQATKLLHHLPDAEITDSMIGVLYEVPAPLRAVALATRGLIHKLFPEGLRFTGITRGSAKLRPLGCRSGNPIPAGAVRRPDQGPGRELAPAPNPAACADRDCAPARQHRGGLRARQPVEELPR